MILPYTSIGLFTIGALQQKRAKFKLPLLGIMHGRRKARRSAILMCILHIATFKYINNAPHSLTQLNLSK